MEPCFKNSQKAQGRRMSAVSRGNLRWEDFEASLGCIYEALSKFSGSPSVLKLVQEPSCNLESSGICFSVETIGHLRL